MSLKYMAMMVRRMEMGYKVVICNVSVKEGEGMIRKRTGGRVQSGLHSGVRFLERKGGHSGV